MRPGAQGSDARMCGGRLTIVGTRARPPPDVRGARVACGPMRSPDEPIERVFGVCMHAVDLYKSSPAQGSLPHTHSQRGQSLSHRG